MGEARTDWGHENGEGDQKSNGKKDELLLAEELTILANTFIFVGSQSMYFGKW